MTDDTQLKKSSRNTLKEVRDFFRKLLPIEVNESSIEVFIGTKIVDSSRTPLLIISVDGKPCLFLDQVARMLGQAKENIMTSLEKDYVQFDEWFMISQESLEAAIRYERDKNGTEYVKSFAQPKGVILLTEEIAYMYFSQNKDFLRKIIHVFANVKNGQYTVNGIDERIDARNKFTITHKKLQKVVYDREYRSFGMLESISDRSYYDVPNTSTIKNIKGIPLDRSMADFDTIIELETKTLIRDGVANKIKKDKITNHRDIEHTVKDVNSKMRDFLLSVGIVPEELPIEVDYKMAVKVNRRELQAQEAETKKIV